MQTKRSYQISEEWQNDSRISTRNVSRSVLGKAQVGQKWTGLEKSVLKVYSVIQQKQSLRRTNYLVCSFVSSRTNDFFG